MFKDVKRAVQQKFKEMAAHNLFTVEPNRERIWDAYLNGFEEATRQEHNCNSCKSFIRQWGGIVAIVDGQVHSIWDVSEIPYEFQQSITNLSEYVHSLPINSIFRTNISDLGTDFNFENKNSEAQIIWEHFFVIAPGQFLSSQVDALRVTARDDKNVLERALKEITVETTDIVLDLIAQNSLYRGKEFEGLLKEFKVIQLRYKLAPDTGLFCWESSVRNSQALNRIRNSAIGTLLVNLAEGKDLDFAVTAFEKVVAPTNYKRPTALISSRMIEDAQKRINELGLTSALHRRYAVDTDVSVNDILFVDRSTQVADVFSSLKQDVKVNPKSLSKVEEIKIEDFVNNVLPNSKSLHVMLENKHLNNFVSLIAPIENDVNRLFKWGNDFSWSYTNGVTDSIKERVKQAGGRIEGELRVSLSWHNHDDLDLHVQEPTPGILIYHGAKSSYRSGGTLDVDMNVHRATTREPVENIIWPDKQKMVDGLYKVTVHNYAKRENTDTGFTIQVEHDGQTYNFESRTSPSHQSLAEVCTLRYSKSGGLEIESGEPTQGSVLSQEKWGVSTNQFTKVKMLSLSPNYWDGQHGNRHFIFVLENCINDESPRPFFNEFLKEELSHDRKVFEVLGSKIKVEPSTNQLSGVGFSDTVKDHLFVKVEGSFSRMLKVIF